MNAPVILAKGFLELVGSHKNMVKSSDPDASLSGPTPFIFWYRSTAFARTVILKKSDQYTLISSWNE